MGEPVSRYSSYLILLVTLEILMIILLQPSNSPLVLTDAAAVVLCLRLNHSSFFDLQKVNYFITHHLIIPSFDSNWHRMMEEDEMKKREAQSWSTDFWWISIMMITSSWWSSKRKASIATQSCWNMITHDYYRWGWGRYQSLIQLLHLSWGISVLILIPFNTLRCVILNWMKGKKWLTIIRSHLSFGINFLLWLSKAVKELNLSFEISLKCSDPIPVAAMRTEWGDVRSRIW